MAIEDAAVLAKVHERRHDGNRGAGHGGAEALCAAAPRARGAGAADRAASRAASTTLAGPLALARDLAIKAMGPRRMLARQDWIYDWRE